MGGGDGKEVGCGDSETTPLDNFPPMGTRPRLSTLGQLLLTLCAFLCAAG